MFPLQPVLIIKLCFVIKSSRSGGGIPGYSVMFCTLREQIRGYQVKPESFSSVFSGSAGNGGVRKRRSTSGVFLSVIAAAMGGSNIKKYIYTSSCGASPFPKLAVPGYFIPDRCIPSAKQLKPSQAQAEIISSE